MSGSSEEDFSYLSRQGRWKTWVQGKERRISLSRMGGEVSWFAPLGGCRVFCWGGNGVWRCGRMVQEQVEGYEEEIHLPCSVNISPQPTQ